jgi:ferric-dicitrate binding protein FerR (iron transport regulator)
VEEQITEIAAMRDKRITSKAMFWVTRIEREGQEGGVTPRTLKALKTWIRQDARHGLAFLEAVLWVEFSQTVLRGMYQEGKAKTA